MLAALHLGRAQDDDRDRDVVERREIFLKSPRRLVQQSEYERISSMEECDGELSPTLEKSEAETAATGSELDQLVQPPQAQPDALNRDVPWRIVSMLGLVFFNESVSVNCLWPVIPFLIEDVGVSDKASGYYIGGVASAFFLCQFLTSHAWGRISDRYGRKPALLIGVTSSAIGLVMFGMSKTYTQAILARVVNGVFSGNIGVVKSYLGEVTNQHTQARAFSFLALTWGVGSLTAPLCGGYLSRPAQIWPGVFGPETSVWAQYPYLLPCAVAAGVSLLCLIVIAVLIPESPAILARRRQREMKREAHALSANDVEMEGLTTSTTSTTTTKTTTTSTTTTNNNNENQNNNENKIVENDIESPPATRKPAEASAEASPSNKKLLRDPEVLLATSSYGITASMFVLFDELLPIYAKAPVSLGGLGFSSDKIGAMLMVQGITLITFQTLIFPRLNTKHGPIRVYRGGLWASALVFLTFPTLSFIAASGSNTIFWLATIALLSGRAMAGTSSFTAVMILVNNCRPPEELGLVNGAGQSMSSLARSILPFVGGALWAVSTQWSFVGHQFFVFSFMMATAVGALRLSHRFSPMFNVPYLEREGYGAQLRKIAGEGERVEQVPVRDDKAEAASLSSSVQLYGEGGGEGGSESDEEERVCVEIIRETSKGYIRVVDE